MSELASQIATLSADLAEGAEPGRRSGVTYLDRLTFKQGDRTTLLKTSDIIWIEAEDYYVHVHARQSRHLLRATLASLEERLDPKAFLRVHRAAIVNVGEIRELHSENGLVLVLSNDARVTVSRSRRSSVEAHLRPSYRRS
jgi:two-component system LytT family response regulator